MTENANFSSILREEWKLLIVLATTAIFFLFGNGLMGDLSGLAGATMLLVWLFVVILLAAFAIVHHAESLAVILGEPIGTLVLTLAVIGIEVMMISAVMLTGKDNPTVARDTMFAVVMIVMNGMIGLSLLVGGLKHHEQKYNLQGATAYLALILPFTVLSLILPNFTQSSAGATFSALQAIFLSVVSLGIYGLFLVVQNRRHREHFLAPDKDKDEHDPIHHHDLKVRSKTYHGIFLIVYLLPLVVLAKQMAIPLNHTIGVLQAPAALAGFLVAVLILSPESMSSIRAAQDNKLQRAINLLLGSVLATIGLTVPAVLTIGLITGKTVVLGLDTVDMIILALTLAVSMITFSARRTNILLGAVHLLLFLSYLILIFEK